MAQLNYKLIGLLGSSVLACLPTINYAAKQDLRPHYGEIQKASSKVLKTTEHIPNRYIVIFKETSVGLKSIYSTGNLKADVDDLADTLTYRHGGSRDKTWHKAVKGMAAHLSAQQAENLANDPDVALVEEDGIVHTDTTQTPATWGLDRIDQSSLPLNATYNYTATGAGITAYIIDTGIHITHQEFAGRATWGTNLADRTNDDCNGHGTHVAGTVGGITYGVAKNVSLVAVKVLGCTGSGSTSGVIAGIDWVTLNKKPNSVANMSLGGGFSAALNSAVTNSINAGVVYAIAAGNSNANACLESPGSTPSAITVGATDSTDTRATYSNFGTCLDLFAPGSSITSSWYTSNTATNTISGTSMATPHVTGAAALYLSTYPGSTPAQVATGLLQNAHNGVVFNPGTGSVNKLLYTNLAPPDLIAPTDVILNTPVTPDTLTGTVTLSATANDNIGISKIEFYADNTLIGTATTPINNVFYVDWNTLPLRNNTYNLSAKAYDAAGNVTSSTAIPVTLVNPIAACYAMSQAIIDPGFELQAPVWINTNVLWNLGTGVAYSGTWGAWLGGFGAVNTDYLYQDVTIPADACSPTVSFMMKITTAERATAPANDTLTVNILDTAGNRLANLATYSNINKSNTYLLKSFDLSVYKGTTIRLEFKAVENASRQTSFYIDDVNLK